jgi:YD repeat-containing protein
MVQEDYNNSYSTTQYSYDTLGNLTQVVAALGATEQNTTTMIYDSLSMKIEMVDPDMGHWFYQYDKSGNLAYQKDAKGQVIGFHYDGLNRLTQKDYWNSCATFPPVNPPCTIDHSVVLTYDDQNVLYSKGKLTKISDPSGGESKEDSVLEYDLLQRVKSSKKKIGAEEATFYKTYDSAGRVISITYPGNRTYSYEYDVAGNLLSLKDPGGNSVASHSGFTALGQPGTASFPKTGGGSETRAYGLNSSGPLPERDQSSSCKG